MTSPYRDTFVQITVHFSGFWFVAILAFCMLKAADRLDLSWWWLASWIALPFVIALLGARRA